MQAKKKNTKKTHIKIFCVFLHMQCINCQQPSRTPSCIFASFTQIGCAVNDASPVFDAFVVREFEKAAIIWEREIRNVIYSAALWSLFPRPISPPHSPRHLQQLADND